MKDGIAETFDIAALHPIQTRSATDAETVEEYAETAQRGVKFPPVSVVRDGKHGKLWLWDGIHRMEAARRIGKTRIRAEVTDGTYLDALRLALGANATHGLRRSNADKRHALEMAWENRREIWPRTDGADPSTEILAEACGLHLNTVKAFMRTIQPTQNVPVEGCDRVGKMYQLKAAQGVNNVPVQPMQNVPVGMRGAAPVRRVFGKDGKTRSAPIRAHAPHRASNVMLDRFGVEIPMEIRDAFTGETARDQIESMLQSVVRLLKGAMEAHDPSVTQYRQADLIELQNLLRTAKFTRPYCVCRICQGNGRGSCSACHETGFQTEEQYKRNPKEFQA